MNECSFEYSFIWIFVHLNKSSFNFIRLIFRSRYASRSRRFCSSWLQSVSRLSALLSVMTARLSSNHLTHAAKYSFGAYICCQNCADENDGSNKERKKDTPQFWIVPKTPRVSIIFLFNFLFFDWMATDVLLVKKAFFGRSYKKAQKLLFCELWLFT